MPCNHSWALCPPPRAATAGNPDEFDRMMMVNATAPMRLIRALTPKMVDKVRCVCRAMQVQHARSLPAVCSDKCGDRQVVCMSDRQCLLHSLLRPTSPACRAPAAAAG